MADSYFHKDKLHLNSFGTRKLLKNIDAIYKVTNEGANAKTLESIKGFSYVGRSGFPAKGRGFQSGPKYCHICSMKGHSTQDCWYKGRNTNLDGMKSF